MDMNAYCKYIGLGMLPEELQRILFKNGVLE